MSNVIDLDNISFIYDGGMAKILDGITIKIKRGEIFGLLGPSGAGKTTILKLLTGQLPKAIGKSEILGYQTDNLPREFFTRIGIVMDTVGLYERLTCYENLKMAAMIYGLPIFNVDEIIKKVGLQDASRKQVYKLSTGMRQRLLMARAVMHNPEILFLDEPTNGLDPVMSEKMHEIILEQRRNGTTIFLTTHNMYEAEKLSDKLALLDNGRIVEYGTPKAIRQKYFADNKVSITLSSGQDTVFDLHKEKDIIIEKISMEKVKAIHSMEPTLEDIFIKLTGRGLNND